MTEARAWTGWALVAAAAFAPGCAPGCATGTHGQADWWEEGGTTAMAVAKAPAKVEPPAPKPGRKVGFWGGLKEQQEAMRRQSERNGEAMQRWWEELPTGWKVVVTIVALPFVLVGIALTGGGGVS